MNLLPGFFPAVGTTQAGSQDTTSPNEMEAFQLALKMTATSTSNNNGGCCPVASILN